MTGSDQALGDRGRRRERDLVLGGAATAEHRDAQLRHEFPAAAGVLELLVEEVVDGGEVVVLAELLVEVLLLGGVVIVVVLLDLLPWSWSPLPLWYLPTVIVTACPS